MLKVGSMIVLLKGTAFAVNQGGNADFIRPWQMVYLCQGRFVLNSLDQKNSGGKSNEIQ